MAMAMARPWTYSRLKTEILKHGTSEYRWPVLTPPLSQYRKAAVLVPLFIIDGDVHVWLTKRSEKVGADKGHVSFPGGMKDPADIDEVATCLRESNEEIGLESNEVECVACYLPRMNARKIFLTPVVGIVRESFEPIPNEEVAVAFHVPLRRFLSDDDHYHTLFSFDGRDFYIHFFTDNYKGEDVVTWGLTAGVCVEIAAALLGQETQFDFNPEGKLSPENPFKFHRQLVARVEQEPFNPHKL